MSAGAGPSDEIVRSKHLSLPSGVPLAEGLASAWSEMLAHAEYCAARVDAEPVAAVHEFRKAVRRCRSMLRLLRRVLPDDVYRYTRDELRAVHRATSALRDRDVVLDTLDSLSLPPRITESVTRRLAAAEPVSHERSSEVLRLLASRLPPISRAVTAALPDKVRWSALAQGVRETYGRARRDMRETTRGRGDEALHDWRKRTKELRYQVELLTEGMAQGKRARKLNLRLVDMTTVLGYTVDLMVLRSYVEEHVGSEHRARLLRAIAKRRKRIERDADERGRALFARSPKRFTRRLIRMSKRGHERD